MELPVVDPRLAEQQALHDDPVQRKLQIDALRERLANNGDEAAKRKLKEACQGFESIFLQKIWEQMRKNVTKEGYLHGRDEETYQSMFDQELARKMAEAGGIGLADMLEQQLSVKLGKASIASSPNTLKAKQKLLPLENLSMPVPTVPGFNDRALAKDAQTTRDITVNETPEPRKPRADDRLGTHPDGEQLARNSLQDSSQGVRSALSVTPSLAGIGTQPAFGMQSQFMLGASLVTRLAQDNSPKAQDLPGASTAAQSGSPFAGNEGRALAERAPGAQGPGQGSGNHRAEIAQALNISDNETARGAQGLPPLPHLDNMPATAPGAGEGNAGENSAPRRAQRALGFNGMAQPDDTVKKSNLNPFSQNWPLAKPGASSSSRGRFGKSSGEQAQGQPELGKAVLDEPSILQAPTQNANRFQAPRNEANLSDIPAQGAAQSQSAKEERHHVTAVKDISPPTAAWVQPQPPHSSAQVTDISGNIAPETQQSQGAEPQAQAVQVNNAQQGGFRQISQKELEDALRRMN